jgi:coenzyme Q-binding protein COQ10
MPFSATMLFDLVADVESYPEFVPFWKEARIVRREPDLYYTDQVIGIGPLSDRFRTVTRFDSPRHIHVMPHRDNLLFRRFHIEWNFDSVEAQLTTVCVTFDVEPRSMVLHALVDKLTKRTAHGILTAFQHRAKTRS